MLQQLKLSQFKQHKDLTVTFSGGLNVICGENGVGKSTIIKAVLYALFGSAAAGTKEHLTCWDAEEPMSVTLDFTLHGNKYEVFRSFRKAQLLLVADTGAAAIKASGQEPVTLAIEELLGMNSNMFRHLMYSAQGDSQLLLKTGASDLQKKLEIITRADKLETIASAISTDMSSLAAEIKVLETLPTLSQKKQVRVDAEARWSRLSLEHQSNSEALDSAKEVLNTTAKVVDNLTHAQQQYLKAESKKAVWQAQWNEVVEKLHGLAAPTLATKHELQNTLKSLELEVKSLQTTIGSYASNTKERNRLRAEFSGSSEEYHRLLGLEKAVERAMILVKNMDNRLNEINMLNKEISSLNNQAAGCPTCKRPYNNDHALLEAARADKNSQLDTLIHRQDRDQLELNAFFHNHKLRPSFLQSYQYQVSELGNKVKSLTNQLAEIPEQVEDIEKLEGDLATITAEVKNCNEGMLLWNFYERDYKALTERRDELAASESIMPEKPDLALLEAESNKLAKLRQTVEELTVTHSTSKAEFAVAESEYTTAKAEEAEAATRDQELKRLSKKHANLKALLTYLRNNRARFMEEIWDNLTNYTSYLTSTITNGLIRDLRRDSAGNFTVSEDRENIPVDELSGARKSMVGLGLRLALTNTFFGGYGFLLLDEIGADMSEANAARVAGMLQGLNQQVVLVSHRQGDAVNATNLILLEE